MPPVIDVKKAFKVAVDNGNRVIDIDVGEHDVSDRIAYIAVDQLCVATKITPETPVEKPKPKSGRKKANEQIPDAGAGET